MIAFAPTYQQSEETLAPLIAQAKARQLQWYADHDHLPTYDVIAVDDKDPNERADRDDAFGLYTDAQGRRHLIVAIAYPNSCIPKDSPLDMMARAQGVTHYNALTQHMIPTELATDICSLENNVIRPAIIVDSTLDDAYRITSRKIKLAKARTTCLNYEMARQAIYEPDNVPPYLQDAVKDLPEISRIASVLGDTVNMGEFNLETGVWTDAQGITRQVNPVTLPERQMVEKIMIPTNSDTHEWGYNAALPLLSRRHAEPNERAYYTAKSIGHVGLNRLYYAHFTSPIRRYPDRADIDQFVWASERLQAVKDALADAIASPLTNIQDEQLDDLVWRDDYSRTLIHSAVMMQTLDDPSEPAAQLRDVLDHLLHTALDDTPDVQAAQQLYDAIEHDIHAHPLPYDLQTIEDVGYQVTLTMHHLRDMENKERNATRKTLNDSWILKKALDYAAYPDDKIGFSRLLEVAATEGTITPDLKAFFEQRIDPNSPKDLYTVIAMAPSDGAPEWVALKKSVLKALERDLSLGMKLFDHAQSPNCPDKYRLHDAYIATEDIMLDNDVQQSDKEKEKLFTGLAVYEDHSLGERGVKISSSHAMYAHHSRDASRFAVLQLMRDIAFGECVRFDEVVLPPTIYLQIENNQASAVEIVMQSAAMNGYQAIIEEDNQGARYQCRIDIQNAQGESLMSDYYVSTDSAQDARRRAARAIMRSSKFMHITGSRVLNPDMFTKPEQRLATILQDHPDIEATLVEVQAPQNHASSSEPSKNAQNLSEHYLETRIHKKIAHARQIRQREQDKRELSDRQKFAYAYQLELHVDGRTIICDLAEGGTKHRTQQTAYEYGLDVLLELGKLSQEDRGDSTIMHTEKLPERRKQERPDTRVKTGEITHGTFIAGRTLP